MKRLNAAIDRVCDWIESCAPALFAAYAVLGWVLMLHWFWRMRR